MDEARGLSYGITISAITEQAEEGIRNLFGMLGRLRAEAAGDVDILADTDQAEESIRDLTGNIGSLGERSADIDIDVDTERAQTDVQDLEDRVTNFGHDPPDIEVDVDTNQARSDLQDLSDDIGNLGDSAGDIDIDIDTDEARRNIRGLSDDTGDLGESLENAGENTRDFSENANNLRQTINNQESELRKLKESYVNLALSEQTSSQEAESLAEEIGRLGTELQDNRTRLKNAEDAADRLSDSLVDVGGAADEARPDVENLGDAAEKSGGRFEKLGGILKGIGKVAAIGLTAATAAVGVFTTSAINTGKAFDSSMSQVAATMGYSVADLNDATSEASQNFSQLREFAQEMGANTAFSASEAAGALNYMALAGYDAGKSMTMLPNVLNLAAAGGIDLASASDMVTDAQSALGLSMSETSDLVDKMAAASSKSNTSVAQLGEAILTVGGTAKSLAGGTTEMSAALGILADNGVKGAEGGTALRNIILSLGAPTDKATKMLSEMGVSVYDVEGNMRPLKDTFGDLNAALSTMTQEGRTQALREIFNKVDLKSVNAMLGTSAERFDELGAAIDGAWVNMGSLADSLSDVGIDLTAIQGNLGKLGISEKAFSDILKTSGGNAEAFADALLEAADAGTSQEDVVKALGGDLGELQTAFDNTSGAAQAMADTQLDNLAGDITLFKSALEGAQIVISDGLTPSLRHFTQFGTDSVTKLSEAFQEGGLTGAMGALGGILSDGLGMIVEMLPAAIDAGMQLLGALGQGLLDNAPLIIDAAMQIVTLLGDGILNSLPVLAGAAMEIIASLASGLGGMLPTLIPSMVETVMLMAGTLVENLPLVIDAGMQLIGGLADGIIGAVPILIGQLPELIDQILGFLTESLPTILEQGSAILLSLTDGIIGAIPILVETLPEVITSICGFVSENLPTILEQGVQILTSLATGIIGALPELIGQIPAIITGIVGALSENFPSIVSTGVTLLLELGAGIISAIPQLVAQLPAIGAAILGAFGEIPGMVLGVGKSIVEGLWSGISSMGSWVADKVKGFASGIVDGIKDFLGIHSPSTVFAGIGEDSGRGVGVGFANIMKSVSEDMQDAIPTNLDGPEIDIPKPNGPSDMTFGVYPNVEGINEIGNTVADSVYKVRPVVEDFNTPHVSDIYYSVNPLVEDFNPPGYEQYVNDEDGEVGYPEQVDGSGNGGAPEPEGGSTGNDGGGFTFAPVVPIQITVEGNANSEALEGLKAQLMAEFEAKMRELYDEFREEELQRAALKNQYAF
ncbi:MAG: phage tail tape measure protein [Oscillospiraceae bacterium]|nr:phage tail tape measure protein [Oscillospiraceae bacterium]